MSLIHRAPANIIPFYLPLAAARGCLCIIESPFLLVVYTGMPVCNDDAFAPNSVRMPSKFGENRYIPPPGVVNVTQMSPFISSSNKCCKYVPSI